MPMRPELRRRGVLLAASLICTALCAGCGEVHARLALGPPRPLEVAIGGAPSGLYAALYAAREDRDFAAGALAVTIRQVPDPLATLEAGGAGVAIASEPQLLAARASGGRLVAIGALVRAPLDAIVSLATHPIASAVELAGATIAPLAGPLARAELATMIASAHLAPASVHVAAAGALATPLSRQPAVQAQLADPWPVLVAALRAAHHPAAVLEVQQAGVPNYTGLAIVVRVGEAHYDGPLLRAFLQSLTRGQRAVAADPGAAAAQLAKVNPAMGAALERSVLAQTLPLTAPAEASNPFGYQNPDAWQAFGAWMTAHGLLAKGQNAGLAITDEFLPGEGEQIVSSN
jgi:putative hydroxymethylpyrimidine transport system substrate-binding protein